MLTRQDSTALSKLVTAETMSDDNAVAASRRLNCTGNSEIPAAGVHSGSTSGCFRISSAYTRRACPSNSRCHSLKPTNDSGGHVIIKACLITEMS